MPRPMPDATAALRVTAPATAEPPMPAVVDAASLSSDVQPVRPRPLAAHNANNVPTAFR